MTHKFKYSLMVTAILCILIPIFAYSHPVIGSPFTICLDPFWSEDFDQPLNPSDYFIDGSDGSAIIDGGSFLLTENDNFQYGRIFFLHKAYMNNFEAQFDFYMGDKDWGSDGLAFHFCPAYDYPHSDGGSLNANCPNGYLIAFDTHNDVTPPYNNEIYLAKGSVENRLVVVQVPPMDNDVWRFAKISFSNETVTVSIGEDVIIDAFEIPDYTPFFGYFGFSAATGGGYNQQKVDHISVCAVKTFSNFLPMVQK